MKGIVFTEFTEMVEERFGLETLGHMIANADLPNGGAYGRELDLTLIWRVKRVSEKWEIGWRFGRYFCWPWVPSSDFPAAGPGFAPLAPARSHWPLPWPPGLYSCDLAGTPFLFLVFPILLVAVAWAWPLGVKLAALGVSTVSVRGTVSGAGPFLGGSLNENLLHLQLFLALVAVTALTPAAFRVAGSLLLPACTTRGGYGHG